MTDYLFLLLGILMTSALHGLIGRMPIFHIPVGRGWAGLDVPSYLPVPADVGAGLVLATLPWTRHIGWGTLLYVVASFTATFASAWRMKREEAQKAKKYELFTERLKRSMYQ
jgi:hypothetical protein